MTQKILVICICAAIGTVTGYTVMRAYKRNLKFMESICAMIAELKRNISYRRDSAASILGGFTTDSAQLKKNIDEYLQYAAAKDGALTVSRGFLSAEAYGKVREFFGSLGGMDNAAQLGELDMYASAFAELRTKAAAKSEKYGALAVKLGFLFGLGVGVLFL